MIICKLYEVDTYTSLATLYKSSPSDNCCRDSMHSPNPNWLICKNTETNNAPAAICNCWDRIGDLQIDDSNQMRRLIFLLSPQKILTRAWSCMVNQHESNRSTSEYATDLK